MKRCVGRQMDEQDSRWTNEKSVSGRDKWTSGFIDGWVEGLTVWTDGWKTAWKDRKRKKAVKMDIQVGGIGIKGYLEGKI